ncbi:hypothetical protein AB4Z22_06445, partial [Paenibacillus sp. TAF58]
VGKSGLLALYSVGAVYVVTLLIDAVFHLDFRIWVMALKPMNWDQFVIMLKYVIPFLIYFLANGLVLHGQFRMRESTSEAKTAWKWFLGSAAINTIGIISLILIHYIPLFTNGAIFWPAQALLGIVAFQFVPVNLTVSLISTYFFRKTGNIYAGAITNALLITWYIVAGQAVQYAGAPVSNTGSIVIVILSAVVLAAVLLLKAKSNVNKDTTIKG